MKNVIFLKLKQSINILNRDYRQQYGASGIASYKIEVLKEIKVYITEQVKTDNRIKAYFHFNCNCSKAADSLGLKVSALQMYITRKSKSLEEEIGSETVELVLKAENIEAVDEVMKKVRHNISKVTKPDLFIKEASDLFPKAEYSSSINLKECEKELRVLRDLTKIGFRTNIQNCDSNKLAYILAILEGDSVYDSDLRSVIHRVLLVPVIKPY
ncbi:MAG TPA: hypothetical protein VIK26_01250 [Clostridium sp.]